jgi:ketol-acid reductoisomerase
MDTKSITIGVIGQGYVGKNYADNLEDRGFAVMLLVSIAMTY